MTSCIVRDMPILRPQPTSPLQKQKIFPLHGTQRRFPSSLYTYTFLKLGIARFVLHNKLTTPTILFLHLYFLFSLDTGENTIGNNYCSYFQLYPTSYPLHISFIPAWLAFKWLVNNFVYNINIV